MVVIFVGDRRACQSADLDTFTILEIAVYSSYKQFVWMPINHRFFSLERTLRYDPGSGSRPILWPRIPDPPTLTMTQQMSL